MGTNTREAEQKRAELIRQALPEGTGPISEEEVDEAMLLVLREAKVRPEIIYAYQKTGRLVTEENAQHLSEEELAEWNAAVDEYRRQARARRRWRR